MNIFFRKNLLLVVMCGVVIGIALFVAWKLFNSRTSLEDRSLEQVSTTRISDCGDSLTADFYVFCGYYTTPRINKKNVQIPFVVIKKKELEYRKDSQTENLAEEGLSVSSNFLETTNLSNGYPASGDATDLSQVKSSTSDIDLHTVLSGRVPLIVLPGGPGSAAGIQSKMIQYWLGWYHRQGLSEALVLMDYRGLGGSIPTVDCTSVSVNKAAVERLGSELLDYKSLSNDRKHAYSESELRFLSLAQCWQIAQNLGYSELDFSAETNATDLLGLLRALSIQQFNIYARSYGTRVAVIAAIKQPSLINSMILDSLHSLNNNDPSYWPLKYRQAFLNLFHFCEDSSSCSITADSFKKSIEDISNHSAVIGDNNSVFKHRIYLTESVFQEMREHDSVANIQQILLEPNDNFTGFDQSSIQQATVQQTTEFGDVAYFMNQCIDNKKLDFNVFSENLSEIGYLSEFIQYDKNTDFCRLVSHFNHLDRYKTSTSTVETVLLAGGLDPVTQVSQIESAGNYLSNSTLFVFPEAGHVLIDRYSCLDDVLPFLLHNRGSDFVSEHCAQQSVRILIR